MPVREWWEEVHIHVECSSRELPRVVAAINGQYSGASISYDARNHETHAALPSYGDVSVPFGSRERERVYR